MKKLTLLTLALMLCFSMFSQSKNLFLSQHFDGNNFPEDWSIVGDGAEYWTMSKSDMAGGEPNEMQLLHYPQYTGTTRIVSPYVDMSEITMASVSFKHYPMFLGEHPHQIGIATSSDNGENWNTAWTDSIFTNYEQYNEKHLIVTQDFGKDSVSFCFFFTGSNKYVSAWFFDEFDFNSIEYASDAEIVGVGTKEQYVFGDVSVPFTLKNTGSETITSFEASYVFENQEVVTETFNTEIVAFAEKSFTFTTPTFLIPGHYSLIVNLNSVNGNEYATDEFETDLNVELASIQRIPMIEHFSSSTCRPCVSMNNQMREFENANPGKYTYTKYPANWPSSGDPYYTEESGQRIDYYNVSSVPDVFIDGFINDYEFSEEAFQEEYNEKSYVDVKGAFTVSGDKIYVLADVLPYMNISNATAYVSVNEKETTGNVGNNGEKSFHHIMMKMLPDAAGTPLEIEAGSVKRLYFEQDLSSTFVEEMTDLEVSIWIQDNETKKILNSHFLYEYTEHPYPVENLHVENGTATWNLPSKGNPLSYNVFVNGEFVGNTSDLHFEFGENENYIVVGVEAVYENEKISVRKIQTTKNNLKVIENQVVKCNIYPNPTNGNIIVSGENLNEIRVYNLFGQEIISVKANSENVSIDLNDFSIGIYIVKVIDNQNVTSVKKIIKN